MSHEHEREAQSPATVRTGMGYPNHREEHSPTPIGWQGLDNDSIGHVSRETKGEKK